MHQKTKTYTQTIARIGQAKYVADTEETENGDRRCNVDPEPMCTLFPVLIA